MNVCKFYRLRDGVVETIRVKVTQSGAAIKFGAGHNGQRLPSVREAREFAAKNGFVRRKPKGRRLHHGN